MLIYLGIVAGVALEGELTLIAAAFAANRGILQPSHVIAAAVIGTLLADWICFFAGRISTLIHFKSRILNIERLEKPLIWIDKKRLFLVFFYRYFYGLRTMILVLFGQSRVSVQWFLACSAAAIMIWSSILFCVGYFLGEAIAHYVPSITAI